VNNDSAVSGFSHTAQRIQEDVEYNADHEVMKLQRRSVSLIKQCNTNITEGSADQNVWESLH